MSKSKKRWQRSQGKPAAPVNSTPAPAAPANPVNPTPAPVTQESESEIFERKLRAIFKSMAAESEQKITSHTDEKFAELNIGLDVRQAHVDERFDRLEGLIQGKPVPASAPTPAPEAPANPEPAQEPVPASRTAKPIIRRAFKVKDGGKAFYLLSIFDAEQFGGEFTPVRVWYDQASQEILRELEREEMRQHFGI